MAGSTPIGGGYVSSYVIEVIDKFTKTLEEFSKKFEQAEKKVSSANAAMSKKIHTLGEDLEKLGKKGFLSITLPVAAFIGLALRAASKAEILKNSINAFTSSSKETLFVLNKIEDISHRSIFSGEQYGEAARELLAVGYSAQETVDKVKKLGDIAAVFNVPLDFLTAQMQFSKQTGVFSSREVTTLAKQGIPVYKELEKYILRITGKKYKTSELKKFVAEGRISVKAFEGIVDQLTMKGGVAFEGMKNRSNTLEGSFHRLKNAVGNAFRGIGISLKNNKDFQKGMDISITGIENFTQRLENFVSKNPDVVKNITIIVGALALIPPAIMAIGFAIKALGLIMLANPLVLALTGLATFGALIYANKEKIDYMTNAIETSRQTTGFKGFSLQGMGSKAFSAQMADKAAESKVNISMDIYDPKHVVKSVDTSAPASGGFDLGMNNFMSRF